MCIKLKRTLIIIRTYCSGFEISELLRQQSLKSYQYFEKIAKIDSGYQIKHHFKQNLNIVSSFGNSKNLGHQRSKMSPKKVYKFLKTNFFKFMMVIRLNGILT